MYEVEVKLAADHEVVRERLEALGAERLWCAVQTDTYYDAPHREFAETDEALRVRREADEDAYEREEDDDEATVKLSYKGPLVEVESKTREEHETAVTDGEALAGVLERLGFTPAFTVEKRRTFYEYGGYTVTLDEVTDIGEFVEVEREAAESDVASVREGAIALLEELGLDPDEQIRTSYLGLLLASDTQG
jgi:adenylate cyclase class 2